MALKKRAPRTLAEVAMSTAGIRNGTRAIGFMVSWGLASADLGREPSMDEYCELHGVDRATFYRGQSAFRKAFPGEDNPTRLNVASGNQERYDDLVKSFKGKLAAAAVQVQAMTFTAGAAAFPGGPSPA